MTNDNRIELENRIAELEKENLQLKKDYSLLYKENEIRFIELFDNIPVAYQSLDEEGKIQVVNEFWLKNLGYEREDIMHKSFGDLWSDETSRHFKNVFQGFKDTCWINSAELQLKKKNGEINDYVLTGSIQKKSNNVFGKTHCIIHNITDLKNLQRELKHSIETKDKFFSIIAHDLRGPISSLNSLLNVLAENNEDITKGEQDNIIKMLSKSSVNILNLLENLLQWSKSQTGRLEVTKTKFAVLPFIHEITEIIDQQAKSKNIIVSIDVDEMTEVFADENMLHIVILNILSNSIKFCHDNGRIHLKTKASTNHLEIEITDDGMGIPIKEQNKIFKLTTSYTTLGTNDEIGTGLGLILCKELVEKNGGEISFVSEENKGTSFFITLPNKE